MKSKGQILKHLTEVGYTKNARTQICAYLVGKGIKERDEVIAIKKGDGTFDEFLKWENGKEKPQPKYKVGDWVRHKPSGKPFQYGGISCYCRKDGATIVEEYGSHLLHFFCDIEPYYPKEGEFFYAKTDIVGWISVKTIVKDKDKRILHSSASYCIRTENLFMRDNYLCCRNELFELRPATESEIQLLKDKVKEKYNKEWNGKEWVEIKKSDKELFEEWKKTRHIGIDKCVADYQDEKICAYTKLYLFAQWVNQFCYEERHKYYLFVFEDRVNIDYMSKYTPMGAIIFNSADACKRAINCLGEELIKTALK